jgi:hypothetical protein
MSKNRAAAALGRIKTAKKADSSRRNAKKAQAALRRLTPEQRSEIGRRASLARWGKT